MGRARLVAIDVDCHGCVDGQEAFAQLVCDHGVLEPHPTTTTPTGGNHHFFALPDGAEIGTARGDLPSGIDVRGAGGWVVAPGSIRPDGAAYVPTSGTPDLAEAYRSKAIPNLPDFFARLITGAGRGNGHAIANKGSQDSAPPVDVELSLETMRPGIVNRTHCQVVGSMLSRGTPYGEIVEHVVDATMKMAVAHRLTDWTREAEVEYVTKCMAGLLKTRCHKDTTTITGDPPPAWVAPELVPAWNEIRQEGGRPGIIWSRSNGWYVKNTNYRRRDAAAKSPGGTDDTATATASFNAETASGTKNGGRDFDQRSGAANSNRPFVLRPFVPVDPAALPPRQWLYGRHYQRRTVSATIAPGGFGKTSLVLVEAIAMRTVRSLLGEQPEERLRIWYHSGEEPLEEIDRRIVAICQLNKIPQEELGDGFFRTSSNEIPLRVAKGYSNLELDTKLIKQISEAIGDSKIDVAILDPLVTLHAVPEADNIKMTAVIGIFRELADRFNCSFDLEHHNRKVLTGHGVTEYTSDDARGASAIRDAVRSMRALNHMSEPDAELAGIPLFDRTSYFRVDRAKGNYTAPARAAVWRHFVNVDLANGDEVGVVVPWEFPGQGEMTPEKTAAYETAERVFLSLLDRFTGEHINISDRPGPNYAPTQEQQTVKSRAGGRHGKATRIRAHPPRRIQLPRRPYRPPPGARLHMSPAPCWCG